MLETTFVIPIIRNDFIVPCLESLYKFTDPEIFRVIVIDQTPAGVYDKIKDYTHHYIRPYRNLGFAKAMNTGIRLVDTPYVSCFNDDIEFLDNRWWEGIKSTFEGLDNALGVNPMSVKAAAWGYGYKAPEGRVLTEDKRGILYLDDNGEPINLEKARTKEGYDWLIHNVKGFIDGITTWATTFDMSLLNKVEYFDERFYPGGGEDYDINARAYDPDWGGGKYRMVATSRSWVYHYWGSSGSPDTDEQSKQEIAKQKIVFDEKLRWNSWASLWESPGHHPTVSRGRKGKVETVNL